MKKIFFLSIITIFLFLSCSHSSNQHEPSNSNESTSYPKLKIENVNYSNGVSSVRLLGYTFSPLDIRPGEFQIFELNSGMNGGYSNIPVYISDGVHQAIGIKCNFENGETTIIKVKQNASFVMILE